MAAKPRTASRAAASASRLWANEAEALTFNATERRAQAPCRFAISIVLGLGAAVFLKDLSLQRWLWLWATLNVLAQLVELAVLWRFRKGRPSPGLGWTVAGFTSIALVSVAYASGSLLLWNLPGLLGPAAAVLILGGCLVNVMMLSRGSGLAFAASGAPHALFLVLGPFFARPALAADDILPVFAIAEAVFVFGVAIVWRHLERLRREEASARALADQRRAEAEAATQAKTRYAAAVSHELRTPLTAILAAADALARRVPDPQDAQAAAMVAEASRMMRRLLDDLLDLAKIEAGRMDVATAAFSPRALLEDVRRFWAAEAAGSSLRLELGGVEALPAFVTGDPVRLRQVLNNLVSNAVKFTRDGAVSLTALTAPAANGGVVMTVVVADTGCGMTPAQLARLFTPFEQLRGAGERPGGTGLGLTISRELARLMGGDLAATSSPQGSRFTVSVAVTSAKAASPEEASVTHPPATVPGPDEATMQRPLADGERNSVRLLVVDDQPLVRQAIGVLLEPLGLSADFADGADEALERLALQPFDLVLMDVNLADMDGRDATRRLRSRNGPNRHTPVIAVTGATHDAAVETYLASGMTGFVAKPLEPRDFYAALDAALRAAEAHSESGASAAA